MKKASRDEIVAALARAASQAALQAGRASDSLQRRADVPKRVKREAKNWSESGAFAARGVGTIEADLDAGISTLGAKGGNIGAAVDAIYYAGILAGLHKAFDTED